ncbi:transcription initiation factor IIF, alpha [Trichuris trichiura]|uniref:Transcription initiation factor IIF subunit alpha n=1 Tax=Trichuris trichiura TaxID=36087 RepID=A0A077Z7T0_TRITR|nr:transcription initiation factor IIF, alpha [Trichuris trichiura]
MSASSTREEFIVRVPELSPEQKVTIFKFGGNLGVDVIKWNHVTLDREDNADVYAEEDVMPKFGAGSEYGKHARLEARKKKLGYRSQQYRRSEQPWLLTVNDKHTRKYRGIREGGVSEHADYWIFVKSGENIFDAYPVSEWYNFMAVSRFKALDIDQAEEKFKERGKVLNQFALKTQLRTANSEANEEEVQFRRTKFIIINLQYFACRLRVNQPKKATKRSRAEKKRKELKKQAKIRRQKDANEEDLIASAESDDGDEEGREIDYMSDTDTDVYKPSLRVSMLRSVKIFRSDEPEKKQAEQLIGVDEEIGMRALIGSDEEEEEENEEDNEADPTRKSTLNGMEAFASTADFGPGDEPESESDSDSDDPDSDRIKSAFLLQKKKEMTTTEVSSEAPTSDLKRRMEGGEPAGGSVPEKKAKVESDKAKDGRSEITEEEVRRYLERKPLSCMELVSKFKPRCSKMSKQEIVQRMATVLKKLKPEQFRRNDTLYFSMAGRRG